MVDKTDQQQDKAIELDRMPASSASSSVALKDRKGNLSLKENEQEKWGWTSRRASENDRIKENLQRRNGLMRALRAHLTAEGFIEVDTPILRYYEDATDNPLFVTLGPYGWPRLHLRTCQEEYTRRCAGTFNKAFEIGKCFRNEQVLKDSGKRIHLPEFTMAEIYEVDVDLESSLNRIEDTVRSVVREVLGTQHVKYQKKKLDFDKSFERIKVMDALVQCGDPEAKKFAKSHNKNAKPTFVSGANHVLHDMLDKHVKPHILQPTFLTHFPKSADEYPDRVVGNEIQRAELVAAYIEIGEVGALQPNAACLLKHAKKAIKDRHGPQAVDELVDRDYFAEENTLSRNVGGGAIGIDRLMMLLCDTTDIRDVVWYPTVGKFYERGEQ